MPRIGATVLGGLDVYPIQKIANLGPVDLVDIDAVALGGPLGDGRSVLLAGPAEKFLSSQVLY